jgi:hypothetical protein
LARDGGFIAIGWAGDGSGVEADGGTGEDSGGVCGLAVDEVTGEVGVGVGFPGEIDRGLGVVSAGHRGEARGWLRREGVFEENEYGRGG